MCERPVSHALRGAKEARRAGRRRPGRRRTARPAAAAAGGERTAHSLTTTQRLTERFRGAQVFNDGIGKELFSKMIKELAILGAPEPTPKPEPQPEPYPQPEPQP
eukprot:5265007-Prymnesium_polylepis.1